MPSVPRPDPGPARRLAVAVIALVATLVTVGAAAGAADDVRPEKRRLVAVDNALAKRAVVAPSSLPTVWKRKAATSGPDEALVCSEANVDLSRFTITGNAKSAFAHPTRGELESEVEVFASRAQATADFRLQFTPAVVRCLRSALLKESADPNLTVTVTGGMRTAPRVGERSAALQLVVRLRNSTDSMVFYVDVVAFQKGRSLAYLTFFGIGKPITGLAVPLARSMAAKL